MNPRLCIAPGTEYGSLTVLAELPHADGGPTMYRAECKLCGQIVIVAGYDLTSMRARTCGATECTRAAMAKAATGLIGPDSGDYAMSLEEVGQAMGISRERVRQLEESGLRKLRLALMRSPLGTEMREHVGAA